MKTRLIIKCSKPEQRAGAEALEKFGNEWAEAYRKAQEQRTRAFKEYLKRKHKQEQDREQPQT